MQFNNRYIMHDELGSGGMGVVYRATDRLTGDEVALKRVLVRAGSNISLARLNLSLAREFQMLASLRHPHIISVLDYGFVPDKSGKPAWPYFTMTCLSEPQTIVRAASTRPLREKVTLIIQMLQALAYLHRRGILHRDLKPANALVADDRVRLLDFGLSTSETQADGAVGTLAYMAPEVITGQRATAAADLFAVGVIAYEMLAGHHPFYQGSVNDMMVKLLHSHPDLERLVAAIQMGDDRQETRPVTPLNSELTHTPLVRSDVEWLSGDTPVTAPRFNFAEDMHASQDDGPPPVHENPLAMVIAKLLARNPRYRYGDPLEVIDDLQNALDIPRVVETAEIRESFLQAASFVGRDKEVSTLTDALDAVAGKGGRGSVWLIGGESGVGKSRLLEEVRVEALVRGMLVLQGQAVSEGGMAYHIWRRPLRRLALDSDWENHLLDAAILQPLVPDIGTFIGQPLPDVPALEGGAARQRLIGTILSLFRRQNQPILLILEDLHWTIESLEILRTLSGIAPDINLCIMASYRSEERPDLPEELPAARRLILPRLSRDHITELSASMLGAEQDLSRLVTYLEQQTEGNLFFLVEVVRALAEEAGALDDILNMTLPESVFNRGIQEIVERRLKRLPDEAMPMLKQAAVMGRQLDLNLLGMFMDEAALHDWQYTCSGAAVLDVQDQRWVFAHDKLREGVLVKLTADERQTLNRRAAEAIESVYADDPAYIPILARHWGETENQEKIRHYALAAGNQALDVSAFQEARRFFDRALQTLDDRTENRARQRELATLYRLRGSAARNMSQHEEAHQDFIEAINHGLESEDNLAIAYAISALGNLHWKLAKYDEAQTYLSESLLLAGVLPESEEQQRMIASALSAIGVIHWFRGELDTGRGFFERSLNIYTAIEDYDGIGRAVNNMGIIAFRKNDLDDAAAQFERSMEVCKTLGDREGIATAYNNLGEIARLRDDHALAKERYMLSMEIRREIGDRWGVGINLSNLAGLVKDEGDRENARRYYNQARQIFVEVGDQYGMAISYNNLAYLALDEGLYPEMQTRLKEGLALALEIGAIPVLYMGLEVYARYLVRQQYINEAIRLLTFIEGGEGVEPDVQADVAQMLAELQAQVAPARFEDARQAAADLTPESAAQEVLAALENMEARS